MTPWRWWVGHDEDGEPETYAIGEVGSREEAIELGTRETEPGKRFWIVEARSSDARRYEQADVIPFLRTRNKEVIATPPIDAGEE